MAVISVHEQYRDERGDEPRVALVGRTREREALDRLLANVRGGQSAALVIRGEAGIGKTALLQYMVDSASDFTVARAAGAESEMGLAYSGLHQLCAPMLEHLDRLPPPQRDALATVFGRASGPTPEPLLVGVATLTLLTEVAARHPLVCALDDAQWLDRASAQILVFVARRLLAERIALVCAARAGVWEEVLVGLPELPVRALGESDARALLLDHVHGPFDAAVCDQMVKESHGNPLALSELPRTWNAAEFAGGFGVPDSHGVVNAIERAYVRRLLALPADTRLLTLAAAADPLGDPVLLRQAAENLGVAPSAADSASDAGLLERGDRIRFAHPLARSAAYRAATADDRHRVHRALAEATDGEKAPDRRAWHRAHATVAPDDDIADELERSAVRAQRRGGLAAAAAFLERASALTAHPDRRGERALTAAESKFAAGAPGSAVNLLATAQLSPLSPLHRARAERLRAHVAWSDGRGRDAPEMLLDAARNLQPLDAELARTAYLEAFSAGVRAGPASGGRAVCEVAADARALPDARGGRGPVEVLTHALATRFVDGYAKAVPSLARAVRAAAQKTWEQDVDTARWLVAQAAQEVWDDEAWHSAADCAVRVARERGALAALPGLLEDQAFARVQAGRLDDATAILDEAEAVREATDAPRAGHMRLLLAAWRGEEAAAVPAAQAMLRAAREAGDALAAGRAEYSEAVLYNGLGRYDEAFGPARRAGEYENLGQLNLALPELVEAGVRAGRRDVAEAACSRVEERAAAANTHWARGVSAQVRALLCDGEDAQTLYRESLDQLAHCRVTVQLARTQLLFGEWLRRQNRRADAREQLHTAQDYFTRIGAAGFAGRAGRELLATGERARKRSVDTRDELTAQEGQIAELAREGLSNPEIGARLFVSPRTVEWHLRKVFTKLGIRSRRELAGALPASESEFVSA